MYGWTVVRMGNRVGGRPKILEQASGGGRLLSADEWMSSARAEAMALLALLVNTRAALEEGCELTVHIDNLAVVRCYQQKKFVKIKNWGKVADRDVWDCIAAVLEQTGAWARVKVEKVTAHQDTRKQTEGEHKGKVLPHDKINEHEWGNIAADEVVGKHHKAVLIAELDAPARGLEATGWKAAFPAKVRVGWGGRGEVREK